MPSRLLWECVNGAYIRDSNVFAFSRNDCSVLQKQIAISRSMPSSHFGAVYEVLEAYSTQVLAPKNGGRLFGHAGQFL